MRTQIRVLVALVVVLILPLSPAWAQGPDPESDSLLREIYSSSAEVAGGEVLLDQVVDPSSYLVGPGDQLSFQISGTASSSTGGIVSPEASVIIPAIGAVSVKGMTLEQAKAELKSRLRQYYPKSEITITLTGVRRFRVPVIGAVTVPGSRVVTASTRASEAVFASKPLADASMRGVLVLRGNDTLVVDLTAFYRLGNTSANPYLNEGDVVLVPARPAAFNRLRLAGSVNQEGIFEFHEGDKVGDLLDLGYGLAPDADTTRLELWRFDRAVDTMRQIPWPAGSTFSDWRHFTLRPDDYLIVRAIENFHEGSAVRITGEVKRPGMYVFSGRRVSLSAVVDSAGGFELDADLANARITRPALALWESEFRKRVEATPEALRSRAESDWILADALSIPGRVSTDFVKLFREHDQSYDILLSDGDHVDIPKKSVYVNVIGRVVQPGRVAFVPDGRVEDYLKSAGGYSWRANRGGTFVIKGGTGAAVKKSDIRAIEPGDIVVVPTVRDRDLWKGVKDVLAVAANLATVYLVIDQATQ